MKKVTHIDGIVLDHSMYISTEFDIDDYLGSKDIAIDGSTVMYVQAKGAMTREVQIYSKTNGWQELATKDLLEASVGTTSIVVTYDDASNDTFYYDHTKVPMVFDPLYSGCVWYNVTINLLRG